METHREPQIPGDKSKRGFKWSNRTHNERTNLSWEGQGSCRVKGVSCGSTWGEWQPGGGAGVRMRWLSSGPWRAAMSCGRGLVRTRGFIWRWAGVRGVIGDRSSRVSRLYCMPPAAHWDPGLLPEPRNWGESRPTWEEWGTLVSADNLEKLKKPTRGQDCIPPLPGPTAQEDLTCWLCMSRERATVSEDGQSVSSLRVIPSLISAPSRDPCSSRGSREAPAARALAHPLCATDGGGGSPQPPGPQLLIQSPLPWPPLSVSLCFSKGSRLCPEAEREEGVLRVCNRCSVCIWAVRGLEGGGHSPRDVYPEGNQSQGGT